MEAPTFTPLENNTDTIISRGISTVPLTLNFLTMSTTTATGAMTTTEISTTAITNARFDIQDMAITEITYTEEVDTVAMATTEISTTTATNTEEVDTQSGAMATIEMSVTTTSAEDLEDNILEHIRETSTFNHIRALVSVVGS